MQRGFFLTSETTNQKVEVGIRLVEAPSFFPSLKSKVDENLCSRILLLEGFLNFANTNPQAVYFEGLGQLAK